MTPEQLDEIEKLAEDGAFKAAGSYALPLVKALREARAARNEAFRERADWMHSLDRAKADILTLMRERDEARAEVERLRAALGVKP